MMEFCYFFSFLVSGKSVKTADDGFVLHGVGRSPNSTAAQSISESHEQPMAF
jgi:hypothetical protein